MVSLKNHQKSRSMCFKRVKKFQVIALCRMDMCLEFRTEVGNKSCFSDWQILKLCAQLQNVFKGIFELHRHSELRACSFVSVLIVKRWRCVTRFHSIRPHEAIHDAQKRITKVSWWTENFFADAHRTKINHFVHNFDLISKLLSKSF